MDNVLRHVVIGRGNEHFGASHTVAAIRRRLGLAAEQAKVSAGVGFRKRHGSGPFTADHTRQIDGL